MMDLANQLGGLVTVKSIQNRLNINRVRAIYLIYRLRKEGFVRTNYQSNKVRTYYISPRNVVGGTSYLDIINKYAPIGSRLLSREVYKIHGREPSVEEALIYAIKSKDIRHIIASLALFRSIKDWSALYRLAKRDNVVRAVGALYDVARTVLRKCQNGSKT